MENYDDVLQFVSKVGDGNLNYRSFQNSAVSSGQSKWHLLNEVANYKQPVEQKFERTMPTNQPQSHRQPELAPVSPASFLSPFPPQNAVPNQAHPSVAPMLATVVSKDSSQGAAASIIKAVGDKSSNADSGFAHLFRKSTPQPDVKETPAKTDSLSALFQRIGS